MIIRWAFIALLILLTVPSPVTSQEVPDLPPPDTAIRWDVHRSLGIILVFQTDEGELFFAHPIVMSHAVPECAAIREEATGDLIQVTETDNTNTPMRHIVLREPTAFRYGNTEWISLVGRTYRGFD